MYLQCLKRWGFRRCEDICWIKTNISNPSRAKALEPGSIFQRTKVSLMLLNCQWPKSLNTSHERYLPWIDQGTAAVHFLRTITCAEPEYALRTYIRLAQICLCLTSHSRKIKTDNHDPEIKHQLSCFNFASLELV